MKYGFMYKSLYSVFVYILHNTNFLWLLQGLINFKLFFLCTFWPQAWHETYIEVFNFVPLPLFFFHRWFTPHIQLPRGTIIKCPDPFLLFDPSSKPSRLSNLLSSFQSLALLFFKPKWQLQPPSPLASLTVSYKWNAVSDTSPPFPMLILLTGMLTFRL